MQKIAELCTLSFLNFVKPFFRIFVALTLTVSVGFEQEKYTENDQIQFCKDIYLNPQLRKKLRMRWFFDVSKVKESSFFKSDLTDLTDFTLDAHLFENINFSFSKLNALKKFHFDKEMRKKVNVKSNYGVHKVENAECTQLRNFLHNGRVRVKYAKFLNFTPL